MIVQYYKGYITKPNLDEKLKITKNGTTAYHIVETLKELGFSVQGKKTNINNIATPCIVHTIINDSYKHFMVVYKVNYKKQIILIADPSDKIKTISFKKFKEIWTNVVIECYPIKKLEIEKSIPLYQIIKKIIYSLKYNILLILLLSLIITAISIICSFYFKIATDNINNNIVQISIIFTIIYILLTLIDFYRNKVFIYLSKKIEDKLIKDTYKNIISLPYSYYHNKTSGEVISRINDITSITEITSKIFLSLFVDLPLTLVSGIIIFNLNKIFSLISITILILYIIIIFITNSRLKKYINKMQETRADLNSYMIETIKGYETIKGLNIETNINNKFIKKHNLYLNNVFKFKNVYNFQYLLKELLNNLSTVLIIFIGCIQIKNGVLTISELVTFTILISYFNEPIRNIIDLDYEIKESKNALRRINNIIYNNKEEGIYTKVNGNIEFRNLCYSYDDINIVLKNINLTIKENEKILVIGNSGEGKSTLFKILMKFVKIDDNKVFINNLDINKYKNYELREQIKYISQNETLFVDTLNNNLKIKGNNNIKEVIEICKLDKLIKNNNINVLIEENGINFSGGEKQRIVLARTLLSNFEILIIDEGLNQVDVSLEREILKKMFKMYKYKTIIIISHRLNNMDLYDRMIKIKKGKTILDERRNV